MCFPYCVAGIFASNNADRAKCQKLCKNFLNAVLKLEDAMAQSSAQRKPHPAMSALHNALGVESQLVREIFMLGAECGFNYKNESLRELVHDLYAGPGTTKDALESAYNHLKDSVKSSKAKKFNVFTKWLYLMSNPYVQHAGVRQSRPTTTDFKSLLEQNFNDNDILQLHPFKCQKTDLGKQFPRPSQCLHQVRKAGFYTNRKAAAATALVLHEVGRDFQNVSKSWAGTDGSKALGQRFKFRLS